MSDPYVGPCQRPIYRGGNLYATTTNDSHDWRLWERRRLFHFGAKPGDGKTDPFFTETWYCAQCRVVDERRAPLETTCPALAQKADAP